MGKEEVVKEIIEHLEELSAGAVEEIATIHADEENDDPEGIVFVSGGISIIALIIAHLERAYLGKV